jgi:hypothetical protein
MASQRTAAQIAQSSTSNPASAAPISAPRESLPLPCRLPPAVGDREAGTIVVGRAGVTPGWPGVVVVVVGVAVAEPGVGIPPGVALPAWAVDEPAPVVVLVVVPAPVAARSEAGSGRLGEEVVWLAAVAWLGSMAGETHTSHMRALTAARAAGRERA